MTCVQGGPGGGRGRLVSEEEGERGGAESLFVYLWGSVIFS